MELKMLFEKTMPRKFETSTEIIKISRKANRTSSDTALLQGDNETALQCLWNLEKKKDQFLTIDRF